ncbi:MAG: hypothetical protein KAW83_05535, partial [Dehalococcoidia bacterium]|nr:hypothetical protein [Dehalococcoidia bacterium]
LRRKLRRKNRKPKWKPEAEMNLKIRWTKKQKEMAIKADVRFSKQDKINHLQFLPDSPEQIAESMERLGPLRDQLCEVFQAAIDRVNKGQQESDRLAIDETRKGDSEDEAPLK